MTGGLSILCAAKLHKNQLERHLELFQYIPEVKRVLVVRREGLESRLDKLEDRPFSPGHVALEMAGMTRAVSRVLRREGADWVVGFNPVPWGTLALAAAKISRVPTCLSLIGMDFLQLQRPWGWPFLQAVRQADAVTVTGGSMQRRLVELGVAKAKVKILPHSVDLQRFKPGGAIKRWDVVTVGQLIDRKRMDVLIHAMSLLKSRKQPARLAILGRGPKEPELRALCGRLDVEDCVDFLGYRDDVETVLGQARTFALASAWEGVPFALMEALASGLVPVMTRVGTIEDWIEDGRSGLLVDVDRADQIADAIALTLSEKGEEMRARILENRAQLSFEHGAAVWREVFGMNR